jgi:hypothetical protein
MKTLRCIVFAVFALMTCGTLWGFEDAQETLDSVLKLNSSLSVEQSSLAESLEALAANVSKASPGFAIKILGNDLRMDGITKNQRIQDLNQENVPVAEILTAILKQGNPIRVMDPADPEWRLVWVIGADPVDAQRQIVLITTRSAAKKRGDKLPEVFQEKEKE